MACDVIAHGGLDVARFGDARKALRERFGQYESFRRTPEASPTDRFPQLGLFLDFDGSDSLNLIEVSPPAEVLYEGISLLGRNYSEVVSELSVRGIQGTEDGSGIEYPQVGLALFNPAPEEDDSVVEGVTIFAPGYSGSE